MSIIVKRTGPGLPLRLWDRQATGHVAETVLASMKTRTHTHGEKNDDTALPEYSKTPIAIGFKSPTGERMKPRGGAPLYELPGEDLNVRGNPYRLYARVKGRKRGSGTIVGRIYDGGYAAYKAAIGQTRRNLILSGQLKRSWRVKRVQKYHATIGLTGEAAVYGGYLHAKHPYLLMSPSDLEQGRAAAREALVAAVARGKARG